MDYGRLRWAKCLFLEKLLCYTIICIYCRNKQQQLHPLSFIPFNVRFRFLFIFISELLIIMIHSWFISLIYIRSHNNLKNYPLKYPFSFYNICLNSLRTNITCNYELWNIGLGSQNSYLLPTSPQTTCSPAISTCLRCIIQVKQFIIIVGTKYNLVCS